MLENFPPGLVFEENNIATAGRWVTPNSTWVEQSTAIYPDQGGLIINGGSYHSLTGPGPQITYSASFPGFSSYFTHSLHIPSSLMQQIIHRALLFLIQLCYRLLRILIRRRCGGQSTNLSSDKSHGSYCPFPYLHLSTEGIRLWYRSDPLPLAGRHKL